MMSKRDLLMVALLVLPLAAKSSIDETCEESYGKKVNATCMKYMKHVPALAISAAIGAISGGFVGYFENQCRDFPPAALFALIVSFFIEPSVRDAMIDDLHEEFYGSRLTDHRYRMHLVSRIFSWLSYLDTVVEIVNNDETIIYRRRAKPRSRFLL
jgi:hypothetical protein